MKVIEFTEEEIRALNVQLDTNACSCGCAFPEIQTTDIDCEECFYQKLISSIRKKIIDK